MANASTLTYAGRSLLWSLARQADTPTEPKNIAWGDPASTLTGSANADVALFKPQTEARVAGTSTMTSSGANVLADTYQVTGTITCLVGAKTITEAGLFDTTTAASTSTIATSSQSSGATTVTLAATIGPASGNFYIQIENEVELVTGGQGTATLTVTRGALGTSAAAHAVGAQATSGGDGHANSNAGAGGQTATTANVLAKGGNLFAHSDFAGIALAVNDSIAFTWKVQLT
jgi:hypothetical protein